MDLTFLLVTALKVVAIGVLVISLVPIMTWVERRGAGIIQLRLGPNRVGPFGLLQPLADGVKFFFKEDITPPFVHKATYVLAPGVALGAAIFAFSVIPLGSSFDLNGLPLIGRFLPDMNIPLYIADVDAGVLVLLAASGMGVFGIIMAGWSSNNKYAQFGGLRSSSQMISYELALGLSVISVAVLAGTLRPIGIVQFQAENWWTVVYLPVGFLALFISGFAETNRAPFDLPEAESELVAGYHTEYSSMKFSMFFMAEYINMITSASLLVTLFLGGYHVPAFIAKPLGLAGGWLALWEFVTFSVKLGFFLWVFVWVRWTLPRFRFDQLMRVGWKVLIPVAFLNVVWAGVLVAMGVGK